MFQSPFQHPDLIFNDASVQLYKIDTDLDTYLGSDVIEIIHKTDPRICNAATSIISHSIYLFLFAALYFVEF